MFAVKVEGLNDLARDLNALSARVRRNTLVEALEEGAEPMRALMRRHAPRDPGVPDIADNMVVSRVNRTIGEGGTLGRQDEFQATVAVGPAKGFFYGLFLEYGWRHVRGIFVPAQPFMRPAFDEGAPKALPIISRALWLALSERRMFRPSSFRSSE